MQYGDQGPAVLKLQTALKSAGYDPGALDSDFGPKMATACALCAQNALSQLSPNAGAPVGVHVLPPWLTIAEGEIGQSEIKGDQHNPRIIEYHAATTYKATDDETPYCSSYVCWVLEQAGIKSTRSARARSYMQWGTGIFDNAKVPPGAIAVFWRGKNRSEGKGHVGFYVGGDPAGDRIMVLGANQSDTTRVSTYKTDRLLGFRWPTGVLYPATDLIQAAHLRDPGDPDAVRWA